MLKTVAYYFNMARLIQLVVLILLVCVIDGRIQFRNPTELEKDLDKAGDILRENFGVHLKDLGKLQASKDLLYVTISLQLPDLKTIMDKLTDKRFIDLSMKCPRHLYDDRKRSKGYPAVIRTLGKICDNFGAQLVALHLQLQNTKNRMDYKLATLIDYIPQLKKDISKFKGFPISNNRTRRATGKRRKRFISKIIGLVGTAINTGLNIYRTVRLETRLKSMGKDMSELKSRMTRTEKKHELLKEFTVEISESLHGLAIIMGSELRRLNNEIATVNNRIDMLADAMYRAVRVIGSDIEALYSGMRLVGLQSTLASNCMLMSKTVDDLRIAEIEVIDTLLAGFHTLAIGKLPEEFVTIADLEHLLEQAETDIESVYEGYILLSKSATDYYALDNIIWAIDGYTLSINLPVYLRDKDQPLLQLYRAESFFIPFDVHDVNKPHHSKKPHSYTKIHLQYSYLAVGGDQYILIKSNTLRDCDSFGGRMVCSDINLFTHKSSPSCLSTLYYQDDLSVLSSVCDIKYYHDIIAPGLIFEDEKRLLVSNVDENWRFVCEGDNFPFPVKGEAYTIIEKASLCECQIFIGMEHYVPRQLENCERAEFKLDLKYPFNSVVLFQLKDMIEKQKQELEYYIADSSNINYETPSINVLEKTNNSQVLYDKPETGVELNRVIDIIKSNKHVYLSADDMIQLEDVANDDENLKEWFQLNKIELGITFVMSLFGVISSLATICFCVHYCKRQKYAAVLSAMLQNPQMVKAVKLDDDATIAFNEFKYRMYLLLAGVICYVLYRLAVWIYNKYIVYRLVIPQVSTDTVKHKCHVYLEIINDKEKLLLYLISIACSMINVEFHQKTSAKFVSSQGSWCSPQMTIEWKHGYFKIYDNIRCELPTVVPIPFLSYRKFFRMTKGKVYIRPLIFEDVFYHFYPLVRAELQEVVMDE